MGNRIFVATVILLWTATMSWLMVVRILPPFFQGEPPAQLAGLEAEPNCWQIEFKGRRVGYAVSQAIAGTLGTTEVHSRVLLEGVDLRKLLPFQLTGLGLGAIHLDSRSRLTFDSLGSLTSFEMKFQLNDLPFVVRVQGRVEGTNLKISFQSGDTWHEESFPVPERALVVNELFPESKLLNLTVGRRWQQEVYSPFKTSLEVVEAEVIDESTIEHGGQRQHVHRIEYRSLSSAGVAADNTLKSAVWVGDDGTVLRQELYLLGTTLRFERCTEPQMIGMATNLLDLNTYATVPPQPVAQQ